MTWIKVERSLRGHPKLLHLASILKVDDPDLVRAKLENLWNSATECFWRGWLEVNDQVMDEFQVAYHASWKGDPALWLRALIQARWIDRKAGEGGRERLYLHDWHEHAALIIQLREGEEIRRERNRLYFDSPELTRAVRARDGDTCRSCARVVNWKDRKTGAGGTYARLDQAGPITIGNVGVHCRSCAEQRDPVGGRPGGSPAPEDGRQIHLQGSAGNLPEGRSPADKGGAKSTTVQQSSSRVHIPPRPLSQHDTSLTYKSAPRAEGTAALAGPPGALEGCLERPQLAIGRDLLIGAGLSRKQAETYAKAIPLREICATVLESRAKKTPAAWAQKILKARWRASAPMPPAMLEEVQDCLLGMSARGSPPAVPRQGGFARMMGSVLSAARPGVRA